MRFLETRGVRTHYVQLGPETGRDREDLVLVHGLGTSLSYWYLPHAEEFAKQFRVTLYDLPGHGSSAMPQSGYRPEQLARHLSGLLDELGIERARLVAHSFGGVVALGLACLAPERVVDLVLADTQIHALRDAGAAPPLPGAVALQAELARHGVELEATDRFFGFRLLGAVARLQVGGAELSPELVRLLGPLVGRNRKQTARKWLELLESTAAEEELTSDDGLVPERLKELDLPVLAMYGDRSRCFPAGRKLAALLPRATFHPVPGAGHFFPSTQAPAFIERCRRYWKERRLVRPAS